MFLHFRDPFAFERAPLSSVCYDSTPNRFFPEVAWAVMNLARCLCVTILLVLPACGAAVLTPSAPPPAPQKLGVSWMRSDAKDTDLVYATNAPNGQIFVYSYPGGKLEGTLSAPGGPQGACTDAAGNVWIVIGIGSVAEYAHGGTTPIKTLPIGGLLPNGCSVDPTTGNLAVAGLAGIAIFKHAKGLAKVYYDKLFYTYYFCGYDPAGDLFIDGLTTSGFFQLSELPKKSSTWVNFTLNGAFPGGVEWDGKFITYGDQLYNTVWQLRIENRKAKVVGETGLFGAGDPVYQYAFADFSRGSSQARRVIGMDFEGSAAGTVAVWNYPAGGAPLKVYAGQFYPTGVAISPATK